MLSLRRVGVRLLRGRVVVRELGALARSATIWTPDPKQSHVRTHIGRVLAVGPPAELNGVDLEAARKQIRDQVKLEVEMVRPDRVRPWVIHLGEAKDQLRDQPLFLRVKFNSADTAIVPTFDAVWQVGDAPGVRPWLPERRPGIFSARRPEKHWCRCRGLPSPRRLRRRWPAAYRA